MALLGALRTIRRKLEAITFAESSVEHTVSIVDNSWSQDVYEDDISPDDSISCVGLDDDARLTSDDVDDIRPEDSISNVCVRDPENYASDARAEISLSKKIRMMFVGDARATNSSGNRSAHDEVSMDTEKSTPHKHASFFTAASGYLAQGEELRVGGGVEAGFNELAYDCHPSVDVDDVRQEDIVRDADLDADVQPTQQRVLTPSSDDNPVKAASFWGSDWDLGSRKSTRRDTPDHLKDDFAARIIASLAAGGGREHPSFGVTTAASWEDLLRDVESDEELFFSATGAEE